MNPQFFEPRQSAVPLPASRDAVRGCLLGGAIGDALGAPVEFLSLDEIRRKFGPDGVTGFSAVHGRPAPFTDDTQMTLFTAEGMIRAMVRGSLRGICDPPSMVHRAYLRWLHTQGDPWESVRVQGEDFDGWLGRQRVLHVRRAPGFTCLSALRSGKFGRLEDPLNASKGCGGVMRAAPAGFADFADPFMFGCEVAALTHGHPAGYLSAGFLAEMIAELGRGETLKAGIEAAELKLESFRGINGQVVEAVGWAQHLAEKESASPETIESMGQGWVAEEALAIAIFCALTAEGFTSGVLAAINHGGDSDSTGAITGNILGTLWGLEAIPSEWVEQLEAAEVVLTVADDLLDYSNVRGDVTDEQFARYPG